MASGLWLEETELRLGLPGGGGGGGGGGGEAEAVKCSGKRGFEQTLDLKLQLHTPVVTKKDEAQAAAAEEEEAEHPVPCADPEKPPAPKAQVVGWPPVRSFRRNTFSTRSEKSKEGCGGNKSGSKSSNYAAAATASFVKVSMDGAPYLRKVDLKTYRSYGDLSVALQNLFRSFTTGNNFMNENKVMNLINGSEYVATYEDKDGDWMLVGDVPWEMFADSCKRLRIIKGSEARGLAPTKRDGEVQE